MSVKPSVPSMTLSSLLLRVNLDKTGGELIAVEIPGGAQRLMRRSTKGLSFRFMRSVYPSFKFSANRGFAPEDTAFDT
jgi:hypothetical protein